MFNIDVQYLLFLYALFVGVYLAVSYDVLDLLVLKRINQISKAMLQLTFFIVQANFVFRVFFNINKGIIPVYTYFIILVGVLIYRQFSNEYQQNYLVKLENIIIYLLRKLNQLFKFLCIEPLVNVYKLGKYFYKKLLKFFKWVGKRFQPIYKKLISLLKRVKPRFTMKFKHKKTKTKLKFLKKSKI